MAKLEAMIKFKSDYNKKMNKTTLATLKLVVFGTR
jgi:hypothetical protein